MLRPDTARTPAQACWQAWFDGSALPNPGRIGIGIVLMAPDGQRSEQSFVPRESGCNNEAELLALCAVLMLAREAGVRCLQVRGDSSIAVRYVNGLDTTRITRLLILIQRAQTLMSDFDEVALTWVPRHRNLDADALSRSALGLPAKPVAAHRRQR